MKKSTNSQVFLLVGAFMFCATGVAIGIYHVKHKSTHVLSQLTSIQDEVAAITQIIKQPVSQIDLSAVTMQIKHLSQQLEAVRMQNTEHVDDAFNRTEKIVIARLDAIQALVHTLQAKQKTPNTYLEPSALPFKVISLDSIQQIPIASVMYDFKTIPLEKDDALASWKVIDIHYGKQTIMFENHKKERVLLTHTHIG